MTNQNTFGGRSAALPSIPKGDVLGTYDTYLQAQAVVDHLAKADFDVANLSIVGNDLKTVERVTGKLTWSRAALASAASGAWFGLFFGFLLLVFGITANFYVVIAALLIGGAFGIILGLAGYAITRRSRDFTSTHQVLASNYQIIVNPSMTAKAQETLQYTPPPAS